MKLFADTPGRRTLQVVADLLFVAWLVLWVWTGMAVHDGTMELAGPARQTDSAATSMAEQLRDAEPLGFVVLDDQKAPAPRLGKILEAHHRALQALGARRLAAALGRRELAAENVAVERELDRQRRRHVHHG